MEAPAATLPPPLTRRQRAVLLAIQDGIARNGVSPSYDELLITLGFKSKSGLTRISAALEERGAIRRIKGKARSIDVIRPIERLPMDAVSNAVQLLKPIEFDTIATLISRHLYPTPEAEQLINKLRSFTMRQH